MQNWLKTIHLEGDLVKLIPLEKAHKEALLEAAADGELWQYWYTSVPDASKIDSYLDFALKEHRAGRGQTFSVLLKESGKIIGCTRYYNATPEHRRLEIGYTWYAQSQQRTGVNTECKYLMLQYAFEELDAIAVQFMTNWFNFKSRNAILRIGAKQDGILRNHRINPDGSFRDSVVFSIVRDEWKMVKKALSFERQRVRKIE